MTWTKIDCAERDRIMTALPTRAVLSSLTDMSGEFGLPRIETEWSVTRDDDTPIIKDVRHPTESGTGMRPDRAPCEHYRFEPTPPTTESSTD